MAAIAVGFPPETIEDPQLFGARRNVTEDIFLMRDDDNAQRAYSRIQGRTVQDCSHGRGRILMCWLWLRTNGVLQRTNYVVVVKKLMKSKIGGQENPNHEIALMQQIGDNVHVSTIIEALIDTKYLYIIMPRLGDDLITTLSHQPRITVTLQDIAKAMLHDLLHLQAHAIIHRDLSPENIIYCPLANNKCDCPLIDLAMAVKCVTLLGTTQRIAAGLSWCGKRPYTSPEAWAQCELDFGVDVWSIGVVLLTLILGERLWDRLWVVSHQVEDFEETLHHVDILYPFFIRGNGLSDPEILDTAIERLLALHPDETEHPPFLKKMINVQRIDPLLRNLLGWMLTENPRDRPTVQEILSHRWFTTTA